MRNIILASSSPQRTELLNLIGLEHKIIPSDVEEIVDYSKKPFEIVQDLAYQKAVSIMNKCSKSDIIIGADTIVYLDKVYGKPKDVLDAKETLQKLQGNIHSVFTGLCIINNENGAIYKTYDETKVKFRQLTEAQIDKYISTKEPINKAGSYTIKGKGAILIEKIDGCFYNVVGLPIHKLSIILEGIDPNII